MKKTAWVLPLITVLVLGLRVAFADTFHKVNPGTASAIYEHAKYRNVKNNCGNAVFVPTNTAAEWQSFIDHHPACVQLDGYDCADSGAVTKTDSAGKYCLWSKTQYLKYKMPMGYSDSGSSTLKLPEGYSSARLDYAGFDDRGNIYINGHLVCASSAPGTDAAHPSCMQYCHGGHDLSGVAHAGDNTVTANVVNSCGDDMSGGVDIRFTPPR